MQYEELIIKAPIIEKNIGYSFRNKDYLYLSFIHKSFSNEWKEQPSKHNERLEFLGDSILGLIIAEELFKQFPDYSEGQLSFLKSSLVDTTACAKYMRSLNLASFILLGRGERQAQGMEKESILADVYEAIIAAIYLDGGYFKAKDFVLNKFKPIIEEIIKEPHRNYKAELQDYCQKQMQKTPVYTVVDQRGPDHAKIFYVEVSIQQTRLGRGKGSSKKDAEQNAAFVAIQKINKKKDQ